MANEAGSFSEIPPERRLPFETIREPIDTLLSAMALKLEREWPEKWAGLTGARPYFQGTVQLADFTYQSVRFLCADKPENPARKLEFAVSVPPLARTILDSVFTVIFLLEDFPVRWNWFKKSAWREGEDDQQRLRTAYGDDPGWTEWLKELDGIVGFLKQEAAITPAEEGNPKLIQWFPNPGKMPAQTTGWRQNHLRYLNDWFYRGLSAESHLSLNGFGKRAGFLLAPSPEDRRRVLDKSRSDDVFTTITLVVALLSEIEIEFRFGLTDRLKYVWGIIQEYWGEAKDLYTRRYSTAL
jgi:hypothetical protein